jgi:hypothetical protein
MEMCKSDFGDIRAADISDRILMELNNIFSAHSKIIAWTFDGTAVMQGSNNSVQSKIREYLDASCAAFKFTESL